MGRQARGVHSSRAAGHRIKVASEPVGAIVAMPRAYAVEDTRGLMKSVIDIDTDRILGAALFSIDAQELINTVAGEAAPWRRPWLGTVRLPDRRAWSARTPQAACPLVFPSRGGTSGAARVRGNSGRRRRVGRRPTAAPQPARPLADSVGPRARAGGATTGADDG
jgi:Pyridine nucleotide-disulphide oxidoreductase, dimerisation domain